jgi:hypothetical protein
MRLEKNEWKQWVEKQLELRKALTEHCSVNGDLIAFNDCVDSSITIYSTEDLKEIADAYEVQISCEHIESDSFRYSWSIEVNGTILKTYAYQNIEEEN